MWKSRSTDHRPELPQVLKHVRAANRDFFWNAGRPRTAMGSPHGSANRRHYPLPEKKPVIEVSSPQRPRPKSSCEMIHPQSSMTCSHDPLFEVDWPEVACDRCLQRFERTYVYSPTKAAQDDRSPHLTVHALSAIKALKKRPKTAAAFRARSDSTDSAVSIVQKSPPHTRLKSAAMTTLVRQKAAPTAGSLAAVRRIRARSRLTGVSHSDSVSVSGARGHRKPRTTALSMEDGSGGQHTPSHTHDPIDDASTGADTPTKLYSSQKAAEFARKREKRRQALEEAKRKEKLEEDAIRKRAISLKREAETLMDERVWVYATDLLTTAIHLRPSDISLYLLRARALSQTGDSQLALDDLEFAANMDRTSVAPICLAVEILGKHSRWSQAVTVFEEALRRKPMDPGLRRQYYDLLWNVRRTRDYIKTEWLPPTFAEPPPPIPEPGIDPGLFSSYRSSFSLLGSPGTGDGLGRSTRRSITSTAGPRMSMAGPDGGMSVAAGVGGGSQVPPGPMLDSDVAVLEDAEEGLLCESRGPGQKLQMRILNFPSTPLIERTWLSLDVKALLLSISKIRSFVDRLLSKNHATEEDVAALLDLLRRAGFPLKVLRTTSRVFQYHAPEFGYNDPVFEATDKQRREKLYLDTESVMSRRSSQAPPEETVEKKKKKKKRKLFPDPSGILEESEDDDDWVTTTEATSSRSETSEPRNCDPSLSRGVDSSGGDGGAGAGAGAGVVLDWESDISKDGCRLSKVDIAAQIRAQEETGEVVISGDLSSRDNCDGETTEFIFYKNDNTRVFLPPMITFLRNVMPRHPGENEMQYVGAVISRFRGFLAMVFEYYSVSGSSFDASNLSEIDETVKETETRVLPRDRFLQFIKESGLQKGRVDDEFLDRIFTKSFDEDPFMEKHMKHVGRLTMSDDRFDVGMKVNFRYEGLQRVGEILQRITSSVGYFYRLRVIDGGSAILVPIRESDVIGVYRESESTANPFLTQQRPSKANGGG
eukprot:Rmarinus@m.4170